MFLTTLVVILLSAHAQASTRLIRKQSQIQVHQISDGAGQQQQDSKIWDYIHPDVTCTPRNLEEEHYPTSPDVDFSGRGLRLQIPRVKAADLTPESFHERFVRPNLPVVVVDGVNAIWSNRSAWTKAAFLRHKKANIKLPVTKKRPRVVALPEEWIALPEIFNSTDRTVLFQAVPFWNLLPDQPDLWSQGYQIQDMNVSLHKELLSRLRDGSFLLQGQDQKPKSDPTYYDSTFNLHLSVEGGALPHSHQTTLNFLFSGAKRWIMVDPMQYDTEEMREWFEQIPDFEMQSVQRLNYNSWDWYKHEAREAIRQAEVKYYDFVLQEGEAIFIPNFYTHATLDLCRETIGAELMGDIVTWDHVPEWTKEFCTTGLRTAGRFGCQHVL